MATRKKDNRKALLLIAAAGAALYFLTRKASAETAAREITLPLGDPNATELKPENIPPLPAAILPDTGPTYSSPPETTSQVKPVLIRPEIIPIETIPVNETGGSGYTPGYKGKPWDAVLPYNADDHQL